MQTYFKVLGEIRTHNPSVYASDRVTIGIGSVLTTVPWNYVASRYY